MLSLRGCKTHLPRQFSYGRTYTCPSIITYIFIYRSPVSSAPITATRTGVATAPDRVFAHISPIPPRANYPRKVTPTSPVLLTVGPKKTVAPFPFDVDFAKSDTDTFSRLHYSLFFENYSRTVLSIPFNSELIWVVIPTPLSTFLSVLDWPLRIRLYTTMTDKLVAGLHP